MKRFIFDTYEEVCSAASELYVKQLNEKPDTVFGFATGSTPVGLYNELVKKYESGEIDFSKARSFNLDEYYPMKKDHPQSYDYFMRDNLFNKINLSAFSLPSGEAPNAQAECKRYDAEIEAEGGIDLMLLGIGHNGHIGFNEPSVSYSMGTYLTKLTQSSIDANSRFFGPDEVQPTEALTMGIGGIVSSRKIILMITGDGKAAIAKKLFDGMIHADVPASFVLLHPDVTVFMDKAAAGNL